jgi:hypothetical protein
MRDGIWLGWENGRRVQQALLRTGATGDTPVPLSALAAGQLMHTAAHVVGWDASRTVEIVGAYTAESAHVLISRLQRLVKEVEAGAEERARQAYPDDYVPTAEERCSLWAPSAPN